MKSFDLFQEEAQVQNR